MKKRVYDFKRERRIFALVMLVVLVIIFIFGVLSVCKVVEIRNIPEWEPTVSYPMANANISWVQTHHPGPWDGDPNGH